MKIRCPIQKLYPVELANGAESTATDKFDTKTVVTNENILEKVIENNDQRTKVLKVPCQCVKQRESASGEAKIELRFYKHFRPKGSLMSPNIECYSLLKL